MTLSPEELAALFRMLTWMGGFLATVLGIAVALKKLREPKASPLPQPFTVAAHVDYATQDEHLALAGRLDQHVAATDERFAAMSRASSASREKIYDLIREENRQTRSEMRAQVEGLGKTVNDTLIALGRAEGELRAKRAGS